MLVRVGCVLSVMSLRGLSRVDSAVSLLKAHQNFEGEVEASSRPPCLLVARLTLCSMRAASPPHPE